MLDSALKSKFTGIYIYIYTGKPLYFIIHVKSSPTEFVDFRFFRPHLLDLRKKSGLLRYFFQIQAYSAYFRVIK